MKPAGYTHSRYTHEQSSNGGKSTQQRRSLIPLDPSEIRIYPLLPNTWHTSIALTNRVTHRIDQFDLISTRTQRRQEILLNGQLLPITTYTELFDELRRRCSMGIIMI
jgi:hypothetical protein